MPPNSRKIAPMPTAARFRACKPPRDVGFDLKQHQAQFVPMWLRPRDKISGHFRYWYKADMLNALTNVRFWEDCVAKRF